MAKRVPRELSELIEQARKNEAGSPPRKHHLVPASYLARWAENGQVRVSVIDEGTTYTTAPDKAARETDYYRLEHPMVDPEKLPPLLFETMLSRLEDNAKSVIDVLIAEKDFRAVSDESMFLFALHLAMSITRGAAFRAQDEAMTTQAFRLQWEGVTDDGIQGRLIELGQSGTEDEVADIRSHLDALEAGTLTVQQAEPAVIGRAGELAQALTEHLLSRHWLLIDTPPVLLTCDEPVIPLGGPGSPRTEGGGYVDAGVVIHPLTPTLLLALFHDGMDPVGPAALTLAEATEINREILANAHRWSFERPSRNVSKHLRVPARPDPLARREGPLPQVDGAHGELYRFFTVTRWINSPSPPPWPVPRWWGGWSSAQYPRLDRMGPRDKVAVGQDPSKDSERRRKKRRR
jgi:hypothetical protein